jgi:hypothetical protein
MFNGDKPEAPSNYNHIGSAADIFIVLKLLQEIEMRDLILLRVSNAV